MESERLFGMTALQWLAVAGFIQFLTLLIALAMVINRLDKISEMVQEVRARGRVLAAQSTGGSVGPALTLTYPDGHQWDLSHEDLGAVGKFWQESMTQGSGGLQSFAPGVVVEPLPAGGPIEQLMRNISQGLQAGELVGLDEALAKAEPKAELRRARRAALIEHLQAQDARDREAPPEPPLPEEDPHFQRNP